MVNLSGSPPCRVRGISGGMCGSAKMFHPSISFRSGAPKIARNARLTRTTTPSMPQNAIPAGDSSKIALNRSSLSLSAATRPFACCSRACCCRRKDSSSTLNSWISEQMYWYSRISPSGPQRVLPLHRYQRTSSSGITILQSIVAAGFFGVRPRTNFCHAALSSPTSDGRNCLPTRSSPLFPATRE
ncbi:hypothetical protein DSECCO2_485860 [anaerobic digester metagenome]